PQSESDNEEIEDSDSSTSAGDEIPSGDALLELLQIQYNSAKDFQTGDNYSQSAQQTTPTYNCADDDDDFF
ncbi:4556_t:CDS:2, partial [Dentiscutata heterogama]